MPLHMYLTLQAKTSEDMFQNLVKTTIKHCCGCAATNVERSHRFISEKSRIEVNFLFDSSCIHFCHLELINLLVVGAVRTYLFAEGDMEIESEFADILKLPFKALVGRGLIFKYYIVLFSQQFPNLVSRKIYK